MIQIEVNIFPSPLGLPQELFWLIVALLGVVGSILLVRRARDFAWKWGRFERSDDLVKNNNWLKRLIATCAQWSYDHWGIVIIGGAILLFFYWVFVITRLFGERSMVNGIVIGITISVFLLFQLPKLLSPHVQIVPIESMHTKLTTLKRPQTKKQETVVDGQKMQVTVYEFPKLEANGWHDRFLFVSNTGINNYETWSMHLIFDPAIKVDNEWLKRYERSPHIQCSTQQTEEKGETIIYSPRSGNILGPNQDVIIGFRVWCERTNGTKGINPLRVEVSSSNRWGDTVKYFSW